MHNSFPFSLEWRVGRNPSYGYEYLDHRIDLIDLLEFLPISSISATHLREKTDRILYPRYDHGV
jgi:hypothetical protein